jgi:hypothetical protein
MSHRSACRVRKRVRGRVESDREGVRSLARYVERIAPVSRSGIDHRARERAGEFGDLTDVDVQETLADELTHARMLAGGQTPRMTATRRVNRSAAPRAVRTALTSRVPSASVRGNLPRLVRTIPVMAKATPTTITAARNAS